MAHIVILMHGVETRSGNVNWPTQLESMWHAKNTPLRIKTRSYGGVFLNRVPAFMTLIPWIGWHYRQRIVRDQSRYMDDIFHIGHPDDQISLVGHSFAGWITYRLLQMGYRFHKIVLIAPAAPAKLDWGKYERQFHEAHVFWSPIDEIIKWAWYGKMGRVGPKLKHGKLTDWQYKKLHSEWFDEPFFGEFSDLLHSLLVED